MATTKPLTWATLVAMEPQLAGLLADAKQEHMNGDPGYCAHRVWYGYDDGPGLKGRLCQLVGWGREAPGPAVLRSPAAYDVAYQKVYQALPDCRHEGLMC